MPDVSLELLGQMVQQILDGQKMLRDDNRNMRRRLSRMEQQLLALHRGQLERAEGEASSQDQLDNLSERVERLEQHAAP